MARDVTIKIVVDTDQSRRDLADTDRRIEALGQTASGPATAGIVRLENALNKASAVGIGFGVAITERLISATKSVVNFGTETVLTAARTESLVAVADFLGQRSGTTKSRVDDLIESLKRQGITTQESANLVTQLARQNLGLENATKLASAAQNAAFISGMNSSEALNSIITGIITLQPEMIRTAGLTVNLEAAEAAWAKQHGVAASALTAQQKQQIAVNAVLQEAEKINGTYALSMQYVGKQLTSLPRYVQEAENAVGTQFLPVLRVGVTVLTDFLKVVAAHPTAFANLAVATVLVVGPLIAAKAAALAGIPSFLDLAASVKSASAALSILGAVRGIGDARAGIQLLGQAAGITVGSLGLLGSAAAVVAVGFAAWQIGRWIADLTGADQAIVNLTDGLLGQGLAAQSAAAQQDAINLAIARGADATVSYAGAIRYNADWFERHLLAARGDTKALQELTATQDHFKAVVQEVDTVLMQTADGGLVEVEAGFHNATIAIGRTDDAAHQLIQTLRARELQVPTISIPNAPTSRGDVLNPQLDAQGFLNQAGNVQATLDVMHARSNELNVALQKLGSEGLAAARKGFADGTLKADDLQKTFTLTADQVHLVEAKLQDEAEATKKATEAHQRYADVVARVTSIQATLGQTIATVDGSVVEGIRYYVARGASVEDLATMYGLLKPQVEAVKDQMKQEAEFAKVLIELRTLEAGSVHDLADVIQHQLGKAQTDELGRIKDVVDAYQKNASITRDLEEEHADRVAKLTMSSFDYQRRQIDRWVDDEEGKLDYSVDNWQDAYDRIHQVAADRLSDIGIDWNAIKAHSITTLRETASTAAATYDYMVAHAEDFTKETIAKFKRLKDQSAAAIGDVGAKIRETFRSSLGGLNDIFQRAFEGGGGVKGAISSMATNVVAGLTSAIPVVGPIISQFSGAIVSGFKKLFGGVSQAELDARKSIQSFEAQLASTLTATQKLEAGGQSWKMTTIAVRDAYLATGHSASEADAAVQRLWNSSKLGADAAKAAIADVNSVLQEQAADQQRAKQLVDEYHISIDQLGPAWRNQQLGETAKGYMNDFRLMVDVLGVSAPDAITLMSDKLNVFAQQAMATGAEVPASMKPLLQQMVDLGLLTDTSGNKVTDLQTTGITFSETFTQGVDRIVAKFDQLLAKLGLIPNAINNIPTSRDIDVNLNAHWNVPEPPRFDETFHHGGMVQRYHTGGPVDHMANVIPFVVRAHRGLAIDEVPIIAQTGEGILNRGAMRRLGGAPALNQLNSGGGMTSVSVSVDGIVVEKGMDEREAEDLIGKTVVNAMRKRGVRFAA